MVESLGNAGVTPDDVDLCGENGVEPAKSPRDLGYYQLMQSEEVQTLILEDLKNAPPDPSPHHYPNQIASS